MRTFRTLFFFLLPLTGLTQTPLTKEQADAWYAPKNHLTRASTVQSGLLPVATLGGLFLKDARSFGVRANYTTDDTVPLQAVFTNLGEGHGVLLTGRPRVRATLSLPSGRSAVGIGMRPQFSGLVTDSLLTGSLLRLSTGSTLERLGIFYDKNLLTPTDTARVGVWVPKSAFDAHVDRVATGRMPVGFRLSGYRHELGKGLAWDGNVGLHLKADPGRSNSEAGALYIRAFSARNNKIAGIWADGYVSSTTLESPILENNRSGLVNDGGDLVVNFPYVGDNHRYAIRQTGAASYLQVHGDLTRPVQGGAGWSDPGETPRSLSYDGASLWLGGGKMLVENLWLYRPSWYGQGYSSVIDQGVTYAAGQNRGTALYLATGTELDVQGHLVTDGMFPFRGDGQLKGRRLANYTIGGSLSDTARLAHLLNTSLPVQVFSDERTPTGGYVTTLTAPGGIRARIRLEDVGKTFYVAVLTYGGAWEIGQPGQTIFGGLTSSGWAMDVSAANPLWGQLSVSTGYNVSLVAPAFADQPLMSLFPVKALEAEMAFNIFTGSTLKLGGFWLIDRDQVTFRGYELGAYQDVFALPRSASVPARGTWRAGDYVENTERTPQGTTPNKYVVRGWFRLTTGGNHVPGTDWAEDRAATGL